MCSQKSLPLCFYLFHRFIFLCFSDTCPHISHTKGSFTSLLHCSPLFLPQYAFCRQYSFQLCLLKWCHKVPLRKNGMGMIIGVGGWVRENLREFATVGGRRGHEGQKVSVDMKEMKECNVGEKGPGGAGTAWFSAKLLISKTTQTSNDCVFCWGATVKNWLKKQQQQKKLMLASTTVLLTSI